MLAMLGEWIELHQDMPAGQLHTAKPASWCQRL